MLDTKQCYQWGELEGGDEVAIAEKILILARVLDQNIFLYVTATNYARKIVFIINFVQGPPIKEEALDSMRKVPPMKNKKGIFIINSPREMIFQVEI